VSYTKRFDRSLADVQRESYERDLRWERRGLLSKGSVSPPIAISPSVQKSMEGSKPPDVSFDSRGQSQSAQRAEHSVEPPSQIPGPFDPLNSNEWVAWIRKSGIVPVSADRTWRPLLVRATEQDAREETIRHLRGAKEPYQVLVLPGGFHPQYDPRAERDYSAMVIPTPGRLSRPSSSSSRSSS
jgi:hypothetical protein